MVPAKVRSQNSSAMPHRLPVAPVPRTGRAARSRQAGLTLAELLVTLAIAAVLLAIGIPGFDRLLHSMRLSTSSNALLSSLRLARSEALRRGGRVAVCRSADGLACAQSGGWEQGWIVFHDLNANGLADPGEPTLERTDAIGGGLILHGTQQVSRTISFTAQAGSRTAAGALLAGTLTLCRPLDAPAAARQIVIGSGGRARVVQVTLDMCL